jgi:DNA-binding transcriptional LysR family regulator
VPKHPQDLVRHAYINMRHETAGDLYAWEFEKNGQTPRVRVNGQLTFNNSYAMIDAAVNGYGIAYVPETSSSDTSLPTCWYRFWTTGHRSSTTTFSTIPVAVRTFQRSRRSSTRRDTAFN